MRLDILEVRLRLVDHLVRDLVALCFCKSQGVGDVDREERIIVAFGIALPEAKTPVVALARLKYLDVASKVLVELLGLWHLLRLKGAEHIAHRGDRDHSR